MKGFIELTKAEIDFAPGLYNQLHPEEPIEPNKFYVASSNIAAIIPGSKTIDGTKIDYYTEVSLFSPATTIKVKESCEEFAELLHKDDLCRE